MSSAPQFPKIFRRLDVVNLSLEQRSTIMRRYQNILKVHILPVLGRQQLVRISPMQIEEFFRIKTLAGRSDKRTLRFIRNACTSTLYTMLVPQGDSPLSETDTKGGAIRAIPRVRQFSKVVPEGDTEPIGTSKKPKSNRVIGHRDPTVDQLVPSQEAIEQWERVSPALLATIGQQRYNTWAAPILLSTITRYDNGSVCWHFLVANEHFQRRWREMEIHIVNAAKVAGISEKIFCEFELKPN